MMDRVVETVRHDSTSRWSFFDGIMSARTISLMEALDGFGYFTTGLSFLVVSMVLFLRAWYVFVVAVGEDPVTAVLGLVHDLLLVIILLELFRTTINFLKTKVITLEPFLYICVIASTRRILTTGAQVSYMNEPTDLIFNRYLMDLGANVLVVVILIVALYLSRRTSTPALHEGTGTTHRTNLPAERAWSSPKAHDGRLIGFKKAYA
ncbi:MAG TPA: phosphate-starvation-inducible PsiE family protein [Nitrospira sp.]|nr:phosphate-starvation-inducible PsiE family protein [Nitrospira sp.]